MSTSAVLLVPLLPLLTTLIVIAGPGAGIRWVALPEQLEDVRQSLRRNTDSGVAEANDGLPLAHVHPDLQFTVRIGVARRITEQVQEHLFQAARVGLQPHRHIGQLE